MERRCMDLARARAEPLAGTAPVATGWLLIEQPGPWGRDALAASGLDPAIGARIAAATADLPVRVQLLRRPSSGAPSDDALPPPATPASASRGRRVLLVHAGPEPWAEALDITSDAELADLPVERLAGSGAPGLGAPVTGPVWLVCAHSKRDRCCASAGRPVAAALADQHAGAVWESSHLGGHRFAANLVVLPEGLVYGGLDPNSATSVAARHLDGEVAHVHLRGRSHLTRPEQAAEAFVRRELGVTALTGVVVTASEPSASETSATSTSVRLRVEGDPWSATVRKVPLGSAAYLSCDAEVEEDPGRFELVELQPAPPG